MSSKEQIKNTINSLGNKMKGYTIVEYVDGEPVRGSDNWVTLQVLLGMTDLSDAEVDAIADLTVDGAPLLLDYKQTGDAANYMKITRVH